VNKNSFSDPDGLGIPLSFMKFSLRLKFKLTIGIIPISVSPYVLIFKLELSQRSLETKDHSFILLKRSFRDLICLDGSDGCDVELNQVSSVTISNCQANYGGAFYVEAANKET